MVAIPAGFSRPDFGAPLDLAAYHAATPATAVTRGMFFTALCEEAARAGKTLAAGTWTAFKHYPTREYNQLAADCARLVYPDTPLRDGLRRVGLLSYPTFAESMIGKVIFGVLGKDIHAIHRVAGKGYELGGNPGSATVIELGEKHSHMRLDDVWGYVDCLQVGVFEGAFKTVGLEAEIYVKPLSLCSAELFSVWR